MQFSLNSITAGVKYSILFKLAQLFLAARGSGTHSVSGPGFGSGSPEHLAFFPYVSPLASGHFVGNKSPL